MVPPVSSSERVDLARLCASKDWSKAIRILDSLISHSATVQDLCNRAFCYSKLELHKHVIKDCDRALQLDPSLLRAYILKGSALCVLGRKENALLVWEQGYEHALHQSADLKQMLELEELIATARQENNALCESEIHGQFMLQTKSSSPINGNSSEAFKIQDTLGTMVELCNDATSDRSEICLKSADSFNVKSESHDEDRECNKCDGQVNGSPDVLDTLSYNSESCNDSSDASESSEKVSTKSGDSVNVTEIFRNPISKFMFSDERKGEARKNKKFCVARISNTNSISVDFRLSRGIAEVNEGKYANAISIFDQILKKDPAYPEALIGRGTAYAFQRELDAAIVDFTKAIQFNPLAGEAWKRRGQARAALGEFVEAIEDLTKALEFEPDTADILHERGIVNFKFKEFDAAVEDLSACVKLDKDNTSAYTYLGLALSSIGEYKKAEEAHLKSLQLDKNFLEAWAHLTQFYQDLAMPTKAQECLSNMLQIDARFARAYHLRGLLFHAMGEHRKAIKDLTMGLSIDGSNVECLYLRGSCYHAVGQFKEAVKDYDAALDLELDSMDKFVLQCLAFYQKEIALYTASKFNSDFCWFDIDGDIDALFKEYWCKKLHPKNVCEKVFRQPPLRESLRKGKLKKQEFAITKQKAALLLASDSIGMKIQYACPGFLPNRRQHRMAGLAAIEIAQKVSKAWRSLRAEWKYSNKGNSKNGKRARRRERINMTSQNRGGAGCSTSSTSLTSSNGIVDERSSSRKLSWHDVYSLAVRWRQISEPCDPVVWVNKLSDEFAAGFGSHTPMILGQAKVVRYFPNYERTLEIAKTVIKERTYVRSKTDKIIHISEAGKLEEIMHAKSCSDLYRVVGEDFWLATWCNSTAVEGKQLEGTRITVVKMGEHGFDFAIRTPTTPARWEDFDEEMAVAWDTICKAYCGENYGSTDFDNLENVRDAILRMTYYWYNFMPLSRGSAAVGFIVMLGLLLAANMEFTGSIPQGLQVDWEAILNLDPNSFVESVKTWLYPSLKVTTSWKDYHDVASTFATTGSVIAALSFSSDD
ncbi:suppressor of RPS4-RLD 1 [Vigna radiata var. radiata]|uniref:Suppressor of RPS4-RLD 1 n=1 Tax=Vigna radiata var. radiata TaxID=3916 RepID=A0A1S3UTL8_VIGRR|nr:suppressor of RPS4-RLD 1 [Vigna radiata var. radiata]XP_014509322.1 suppressor of RPS4-RLD 1 [Vigna radiata var. radiata]XP_022639076.1 suppressor of RPS4-RLD 1 [Vigna radiata var. radiata]